MNVDITELIIFFDELTKLTDEEKGFYWFKTTRPDGIIVTIAISIYEEHINITINNTSNIDISSLSLEKCTEIKVLDEKRKCLEILFKNEKKRCFLSVLGTPILEYTDLEK